MKFNKNIKTEDLPLPNFSLTEIFLLQVVIYSLLWFFSEYTATLLTIIFPVLFIFLFIIALLAEAIEKSKTPRWYYKFMIISIISPLITALFFIVLIGVDFDWSKL